MISKFSCMHLGTIRCASWRMAALAVQSSIGPVTALAFSSSGDVYSARNGWVTKQGSASLPQTWQVLPWRIHGLQTLGENSFLAWGGSRVVVWVDGRERWGSEASGNRILEARAVDGTACAVVATGAVVRLSHCDDPVWQEALGACERIGELRCASLDEAVAWVAGGDALGRLATTSTLGGPTKLANSMHGGVVTSVCWSSDGRRLCSTSDDLGVRCWSADNVEVEWCGVRHSARVWDAKFCDCDESIVSCAQDAEARLWRTATGELMAVFQAHAGKHAWRVATIPGLVATGGGDSTVRVWPTSVAVPTKVDLGSEFVPTGIRLALSDVVLVACDDAYLRRVDIAEGNIVSVVAGPECALCKATVIEPRTGTKIAAICGADRGWVTVCRWETEENQSPQVLAAWKAGGGNEYRALACWWLPEERLIVSTADGCLTLWSSVTNLPTPIRAFERSRSVRALAIDIAHRRVGDATMIAIGDSRGRVSRFMLRPNDASWFVEEELPRGTRISSDNGVSALSWTGDDCMRCLTREGRVIYVDGKARIVGDAPIGPISRVSRPSRATDVAAGYVEDNHLVAVNVETGRRLVSLLGVQSRRPHDVFASSRYVAIAAADRTTLYHARVSAAHNRDFGPFLVADGVAAAIWLSRSELVCSGGSGQLATYVYQPMTHSIVRIQRQSPAVHAERALATTNQNILATASKHHLRVWDWNAEGQLVLVSTVILHRLHRGSAQDQRIAAACAWHRRLNNEDALVVALGDSAGIISLCDAARVVHRIVFDNSPVLSLARCASGPDDASVLIAGDTLGRIVIWQVSVSLSSASVSLVVGAHDAGVNALCARPTDCERGGILTVTGGDDHAIATLAFSTVSGDATFERVPRYSPTTLVGTCFGNSGSRLYTLASDVCLCAWELAEDRTLHERQPKWRIAASIADSISFTLIARIDLDLGDAKGLHVAPAQPNDDFKHSDDADRILVYAEGGLAIVFGSATTDVG